MEDIDNIIRAILSKHNLSTEKGRDDAFEECVEFAERDLAHDLRCNSFLRKVAELLEKDAVEYDVIRDMVDMPDDAVLDISYEERHGFVITANSSGLQYLAKLLQTLSEAPPGEHVHLYNDEDPLVHGSFNAVFYVEEDEWFDRLENHDDSAGKTEYRTRSIPADEVFAFQIVSDVPHDVLLTRDRIYKVEEVGPADSEIVWRKPYHGDDERYVGFMIYDDNDHDVFILLHLDDPDVNYFRETDFTSLLD